MSRHFRQDGRQKKKKKTEDIGYEIISEATQWNEVKSDSKRWLVTWQQHVLVKKSIFHVGNTLFGYSTIGVSG